MKKFIITLAIAIVVALLGFLGFNFLKNMGPRERVKGENGGNIIVEELSYYCRGAKVFGKVYKPADENGNFPDSLGSRPVVIFFYEPLKTSYPESVLKSLVSKGVIGYASALHEKGKDVPAVVKKIKGEKFTDPDLIFLIGDSYSSEAVVEGAAKLKSSVAGVVLIGPSLEAKGSRKVSKLGYEVLTIDAGQKSSAVPKITEYLELKGAMK